VSSIPTSGNINKMNWVPLLVKSSLKDKEEYIWTGKTLKVPFDSKIIKNINLEAVSFNNGKSNWVLTLKDGDSKYLIDVAHLNSTQFIPPYTHGSSLIKNKGDKFQESYPIDTKKNMFNKISKENQIHKSLKKEWDLTLTHKNHHLRSSGILIRLSGRLRGIEKAKSLTLKKGSIRMQSFNAKIDYARKDIITKWGIWGMKVYLAA
jgi:hypothetical protein